MEASTMDVTLAPLLLAQCLEALMLICFGLAWPINLLSMLRCGRPQGKGLTFTTIIWCGYVAGAMAKISLSVGTGAPLSPVFWLYLLNVVTVGLNAWLYRRLRNADLAASNPT
jgi:lipopolysaccharide export LptBFGC system permease protein LptF